MKREGLLAGLFALFAVTLVVGVFVYLMVVRTPFTSPLGNPQTAANAGPGKTAQSQAATPATTPSGTAAAPPTAGGAARSATASAPAPSAGTQPAGAATGLQAAAGPSAAARSDQNRADPSRAAPPVTAPPPAAAGKANVPNPPSFDIVRVEPSGSAVLAGQADPGARIEIMDADKVIATAKANQRGEWVASLDKPLPPGTHDLALRTTASDQSTQTISDQRVAVQVPERGSTDLLVVASAPNAPSRIIAAPPASTAAAGRPAGTTPAAPQGQPDPASQAANPDRGAPPAATNGPTTPPPGPAVANQATPVAGAPPEVNAPASRTGAGPAGPIETAANAAPPTDRRPAGDAGRTGAQPPPSGGPAQAGGQPLLAEAGAGGPPPAPTGTREFTAPRTGEAAGGAGPTVAADSQGGTPPAAGKAEPRVQTAGADRAGETPAVPPSVDGKPATVEAATGAATALAAASPVTTSTAAVAPAPAPAAGTANAGEGATQKVPAEATPDRRPTVLATVPVGGGPQILSTAQSGNPAGGVSIIRGGAIGTAFPPAASGQRSGAAILSLAPPPASGGEVRGPAAPTTLTGIAGGERTGAIGGAKGGTADVQVANVQPLAGREAAPVSAPALSVEAVEADTDGKLFIAGSAAAIDPIRVYVDDAFMGEIQPKGGRWLLETSHPLSPGQYAVRADQVSGASGLVIARAEVPFQREADVAILRPVGAAGSPLGAQATGAIPDPQTVIIRRGDNLWTISRRLYGDGSRYSTIYQANTDQIRNPHWIYPGQIFVIPADETVRKN